MTIQEDTARAVNRTIFQICNKSIPFAQIDRGGEFDCRFWIGL